MAKKPDQLGVVNQLLKRVSMNCLGHPFFFRAERDNRREKDGRLYVQVIYYAPCTKTGIVKEWHGRKWYLSDYMTDDEVIKTAYAAFEAAVKHEIMEGFKVDGTILFNPHTDYRALLKISNEEIKRQEHG